VLVHNSFLFRKYTFFCVNLPDFVYLRKLKYIMKRLVYLFLAALFLVSCTDHRDDELLLGEEEQYYVKYVGINVSGFQYKYRSSTGSFKSGNSTRNYFEKIEGPITKSHFKAYLSFFPNDSSRYYMAIEVKKGDGPFEVKATFHDRGQNELSYPVTE